MQRCVPDVEPVWDGIDEDFPRGPLPISLGSSAQNSGHLFLTVQNGLKDQIQQLAPDRVKIQDETFPGGDAGSTPVEPAANVSRTSASLATVVAIFRLAISGNRWPPLATVGPPKRKLQKGHPPGASRVALQEHCFEDRPQDRRKSHQNSLQTVALATWLCRHPIATTAVYTLPARASTPLATILATLRPSMRSTSRRTRSSAIREQRCVTTTLECPRICCNAASDPPAALQTSASRDRFPAGT